MSLKGEVKQEKQPQVKSKARYNYRQSFCGPCYKYTNDHLKEKGGDHWDILKPRQVEYTTLSSHSRLKRHQQAVEWEKRVNKVVPSVVTTLDMALEMEEIEMTNNIGTAAKQVW